MRINKTSPIKLTVRHGQAIRARVKSSHRSPTVAKFRKGGCTDNTSLAMGAYKYLEGNYSPLPAFAFHYFIDMIANGPQSFTNTNNPTFSVSSSECAAGNTANSMLFTAQPVHPDPTKPVVLDTKPNKAMSSTASASGEVVENVLSPRERRTANLYVSSLSLRTKTDWRCRRIKV